MFATIASLLVAFWFYRSAVSAEKNPFKWIALGLIVFYATMQFWSSVILKPIMGREFYQHSISTALTIEISAVLVGIAVVAFINYPGGTAGSYPAHSVSIKA